MPLLIRGDKTKQGLNTLLFRLTENYIESKKIDELEALFRKLYPLFHQNLSGCLNICRKLSLRLGDLLPLSQKLVVNFSQLDDKVVDLAMSAPSLKLRAFH